VYTDISGASKMNFKDISSGNLTNLGRAVAAFIGNSNNRFTPRQYSVGTSFTPPKVYGVTGTGNKSGQVDLRIAANIFPGNNGFLWSEWPQTKWFEVYRSSNQNLSDEQYIGRAYPNNQNPAMYHDSGLATTGLYYYRVQAVSIKDEKGGFSDTVLVLMSPKRLFLPLFKKPDLREDALGLMRGKRVRFELFTSDGLMGRRLSYMMPLSGAILRRRASRRSPLEESHERNTLIKNECRCDFAMRRGDCRPAGPVF
jgi:hypothetical protein